MKIVNITMAIIVIFFFIVGGISLIWKGIKTQSKINNKYSEENKLKLQEQLQEEKGNLITSKETLEKKVKPTLDKIKELERHTFNGFNDAYYEREDKIKELRKSISQETSDINAMKQALDENFYYCTFDKTKNNQYSSKYCSIKNKIKDLTEFNKKFESDELIPYYMGGGFIIIFGIILASSLYATAKRREILAFEVQQSLPITKETVKEIAPTLAETAKEITPTLAETAKEITPTLAETTKEITPTLAETAKEITKGIKEGINEADDKVTKSKDEK